jgi:hypothetical protein
VRSKSREYFLDILILRRQKEYSRFLPAGFPFPGITNTSAPLMPIVGDGIYLPSITFFPKNHTYRTFWGEGGVGVNNFPPHPTVHTPLIVTQAVLLSFHLDSTAVKSSVDIVFAQTFVFAGDEFVFNL